MKDDMVTKRFYGEKGFQRDVSLGKCGKTNAPLVVEGEIRYC